MKVRILCESPADEAAIRILLRAILGDELETVPPSRGRPGGLEPVLRLIPPTLKELHYQRTADALVVAVDSDQSEVHRPEHEEPNGTNDRCRVCRIEERLQDVRKNLTAGPGSRPIETAVAVATPAIEAWYQFGSDPGCTEVGWIQKLRQGVNAREEIKRLKRAVYGTDRPSLSHAKQCAVESAERLTVDLGSCARAFPHTFGRFVKAVERWPTI